MEDFLASYGRTFGYFIVLLGSFVEGESIVLPAGILAYSGFFSFPGIIAVAFTGSLCADQLLYFVGRHYGPRFLQRRPRWAQASKRAFALLKKYNTIFILGFRFVYGIRTISPLVIGTSGISIKRFAILNFVAAAIWATLSCSLGYFMGYLYENHLEHHINRMGAYKTYAAVAVLAIIVGCWVLWKLYKRSRIGSKTSL